MSNMDHLREERTRIKTQLRHMLEQADRNGRPLAGTDLADYRSLNDRLRNLNQTVAYEAHRSAPPVAELARPGYLTEAVGSSSRWSAQTEEVRRWVADGRPVSLPVAELLAGKRTGHDGRIEHRDVYTTSTGAPVPSSMASTIYEYLLEGSGVLRSNVQIIRTPGGESFKLPKFTAYSVGSAVAQGSAIPEDDPTFDHVEFKSWKYGCITQASSELLADAVVDVGPYLAANLGNALSEAYAPTFITGNGTTEAQGIVTAGSVTVTGATAVSGAFTADDLIDLYFDVASPYRTNGAWIMSDSALNTAAKLKTSGGDYLLTAPMSSGLPAQILGRPVFTDPHMPAVGTAAKSVAFGDWSRAYAVRFAGDVRIELSTAYAFDRDVLTWRALARLDGRVVDGNAYRLLAGGTA